MKNLTKLSLLAGCLASTLVGSGSHASGPGPQRVPVTVSPASNDSADATVAACPTLSWSGVPGAEGYEVQVLERAEDDTLTVLLETAVAKGRAWAPPWCLEEGPRYAWRVRAVGAGLAAAWSEPARFRVAAGGTLRAALEEVTRRLTEENRLTDGERDWLRQLGLFESSASSRHLSIPEPIASASVASNLLSSAPHPRNHSLGSTSLHIEAEGSPAGVVAIGTSFGVLADAEHPGGAVVGSVAGPGGGKGVHGVNSTTLDSSAPFGTAAVGVRGSGAARGARGTSPSSGGRGAKGVATFSDGGFHTGAKGESASSSGRGAEGRALGTAGTNYGVLATALSGGFHFYAGGNGTDYGPFTGAHLARIDADTAEILPGMVMSVTGEAEALYDSEGSPSLSSTLPTIRLATRPGDPAVLGAFVAEATLDADNPWLGSGDARVGIVNALGEGRIWVSDVNGPVRAGDYLTSSSLPGYAQRQGDTALAAHTVAKAIETVDWDSVTQVVSHQGARAKVALIAVVYTGG